MRLRLPTLQTGPPVLRSIFDILSSGNVSRPMDCDSNPPRQSERATDLRCYALLAMSVPNVPGSVSLHRLDPETYSQVANHP